MAWHDSGELTEIGHGVTIKPVYWHDEVIGLYEGHFDAEGRSCMGMVNFEDTAWSRGFAEDGVPITTWQLISMDPLTIEPSVLCRTCGNHGFIREGEWVPA